MSQRKDTGLNTNPWPKLVDHYRAYRLPDMTWSRAIVKCQEFNISYSGFTCTDKNLHRYWHEIAQWDLEGNTLIKSWMPALQQAPIKIESNNVIISSEYR